MAINGCLMLAWLEEDDPSRGFFRVKPAAVMAAEPRVYVHEGEYGEEGFLRIVPDKNEMSTFKLRMRTLGRLCLIDLRMHPRENDKIRQNKNYVVGTDKNPCMIYSDVIRGVPDGMICEVSCGGDSPLTAQIYRIEDGVIAGPYRRSGEEWERCEGFAAVQPEQCGARLLELNDASGNSVRLLMSELDVDGLKLSPISDFVPEREPRVRAQQPAQAEPVEAPAVAEAPAAPAAPEPPAAPAPQEKAQKAQAPDRQAVRPEPAEAAPADKVEDALPYALKLLKEQMGLNPRRGRSLSEVVDEQWRMRKQEELAQSVPPLAESAPVESPAERAVSAVNEAWQFPGTHAPLLAGILGNEELMRRLLEVCGPRAGAAPSDERLVELEAERLRLVTEIDGLRRRSREMKAEVLRELKRTGEIDAETLRNSIVLLEEQLAERKDSLARLEEQARKLEESMRNALGRPMSERVADMLVDARVRELIGWQDSAGQPEEGVPAALPAEEPEETALLAPDELIDRVSLGLRAHGWQLRRDDVVHMLTVRALERALILSGFTGMDDAEFAAVLADVTGDEELEYCDRINGQAEMLPLPRMFSLYSICDYPDGQPICAAHVDGGFLLRDTSGMCLPGAVQQLPAIDPASYAPFAQGELSESMAERLNGIVARLSEFGARISHGALSDCAWYVAAAAQRMSGGEAMALDYAVAYRMLPAVLVSASDALIRALPGMLEGMGECARMMRAPLPVER